MHIRNISDQNLDDELRRHLLAYGQRFDMQTGFLNYKSFLEALHARLQARTPGRETALLWIDVLNMRKEFALWGSRGSEVLIEHITETLRSAASEDMLIGRFSGRSFLVALDACKESKADRQRIQGIIKSLLSIRTLASHAYIEAVAGVAFSPSDTETAEDLVRFASMAATRASSVKNSSVLAFHAGMNDNIVRNHRLEVEMHKALDENQFSIVYQPKIELTTGRILGAEALIRWHHPEWGTVMPSEFIPVAERSDLAHRILDFMLRTSLSDVQRWNDVEVLIPLIAVNMSWANMRRDDFAGIVQSILTDTPIAPATLELEITESVLFDDEQLFSARMRQLRAIGVRVAIDDFGTRYTGFNMLKELPLDAMKIDRCFIHGIDRSRDMQALCTTIVAMAQQLKLRTVAEGVEKIEELEALKHIGCDAAQGFLFQQPIAASEFSAFVREWPVRMSCFGFSSGSSGS